LASKLRKDEISKYKKWYSPSAPQHESGLTEKKEIEEDPAWLKNIKEK
jgi:hypothetical protein